MDFYCTFSTTCYNLNEHFLFIKDTDDVVEKLMLPLVVSGINIIMPMAFRIIASLERYRSPRTTINVNLARY